ncbi:MAG TPA: beta-galactosidase, partial [Lachnospiraceae bacterium]|nr:beta-galactosidase [Lachnospiraceae bacterium]
MTYGGLYRDVFLTVKDSVSMTDIAIRPDYDGGVTTEGLANDAIKDLEVAGRVETDLYLSRDAKQTLKEGRLSIRQSLNADVILERNLSEGLLVPSVNVDQFLKGTEVPEHVTIVSDAGQVKLWDVESPETYSLVTELLYDNEPVDQSVKRIGFRKAEFRADGFYLNGRLLKIRGLNRHQSYPYVGYAMPQSMQRLDARILKKELGVNTVRTSHYPQSHDFIDECDR